MPGAGRSGFGNRLDLRGLGFLGSRLARVCAFGIDLDRAGNLQQKNEKGNKNSARCFTQRYSRKSLRESIIGL